MATGKKVVDRLETTIVAEKEAANDVVLDANQQLVKAESLRKSLLKEYKAEELVPMYLSPMYQPYFGKVMQVSINGISIFFKVDGTTQQVPQTFADEISARRIAVDEIENKKRKMADIPSNVEGSPGELTLF